MEQLTQPDLLQDIEEQLWQEPATIGQRFINYLLDLILFYVIMVIVGFLVGIVVALTTGGVQDFKSDSYQTMFFLITLVTYIMFYTIIEASGQGKTLGKLITRTRAIRTDGSRLSWKDAFIRSLCRLIPFEPFSAFFGSPWHDNLSKTIVVQERK